VTLPSNRPPIADEEPLNAERTLALARKASDARAAVVTFPKLGLSGYTNEDLVHQRALIQAVTHAIERIVAESATLGSMIVVGAPLQAELGLFNTGS
jgi:NAD+ synthase (glutamine-hydrolysing)